MIVVYALWGVVDWKLFPHHLETILAKGRMAAWLLEGVAENG